MLILAIKGLIQQINSEDARDVIHRTLEVIYNLDFSIPTSTYLGRDTQPLLRDIAAQLEAVMFEQELKAINLSALKSHPTKGGAFVKWLQGLITSHKSSVHPLYNEYICKKADTNDLAYYFAQETTLDPRFDDILAYMQVGASAQKKMEIASNYWDEMGNGEMENVHTRLFALALNELNITPEYIHQVMLPDARLSGNLSAALAVSRRHYYKAVGYFGVTEYLAPRRFKHVVKAWYRNGLPQAGVTYHELHIHIDTAHAKAWLNNVIAPIIDRHPELGYEIALGTMIRLNSSERYLDAMYDVFENKDIPEVSLFKNGLTP